MLSCWGCLIKLLVLQGRGKESQHCGCSPGGPCLVCVSCGRGKGVVKLGACAGAVLCQAGAKGCLWLPAFPAASPGCSEVLRAPLEGSSTYVLKLHGDICHGVFSPLLCTCFFCLPFISPFFPLLRILMSVFSDLVAHFFCLIW